MADVKDYIVAAKVLRLDEGEFEEDKHPRDEKGMFTVVASGNTFARKEKLKAAGYNFHGESKTWRKSVVLSDSELKRVLESKGKDHPDRPFRISKLGDVNYKDLKISLGKPYPMNHTEAKSGRFERSYEVYKGSEYKESIGGGAVLPGDRGLMSDDLWFGGRTRR